MWVGTYVYTRVNRLCNIQFMYVSVEAYGIHSLSPIGNKFRPQKLQETFSFPRKIYGVRKHCGVCIWVRYSPLSVQQHHVGQRSDSKFPVERPDPLLALRVVEGDRVPWHTRHTKNPGF